MIIHWRSLITGHCGQGTQQLSEEVARLLVHELNQEWDGLIVHWFWPAKSA